ncbi:uncharacterized protein LOC121620980 [Chelmon rostratus]|uniref:uncharacterized protein LOC121620980 n=1 Tax=Chelmon rostratus TaxID=109905 RepID=UPI001BE9E84D|nr:uncharacterized protein LOC121620980 [Chelmon rostratus]XP_041813193.1 uncharacterized protein LOC121620980 [Chelmon rostratus]XP_041813195.1 uncharacterized protein LOC121620980 [Chelmon rostratus]
MERRRTRLRAMSAEEEDRDRRTSSRNRKRARYAEDDVDEEDETQEEEDEEDNEQPYPSAQNSHSQRMQENKSMRVLTVTCGNRSGVLDVEKLEKGQRCIMCKDRWFSPPAFEDFGGKGSCKKWKTSIFHDNKPLQFLFEQRCLTTTGYKRRGSETTKQKKIRPSNRPSTSSSEGSEIRSAEEAEEEYVTDEDWHAGREELLLEPEEERVGAENGREVVDSGVHESKEEEDKMEKGEMEDEDSVADDDSVDDSDEEREAKLRISTPERRVLQKEVKVIIRRLPQFQVQSDCQSNYMADPLGDSCRWPLDDHALSEEKREHASAIDDTAAIDTDSSEMSDPPDGAEEENEEESTRSNRRKSDRQTEIKTETQNSPAPGSGSAASSQDVKPETEGIAASGSPPAILSSSIGLVGNMKDDLEERKERGQEGKERQSREMGPEIQTHLDMSRSEASGQPSAPGNTSDAATVPVQRWIKEESTEAMWKFFTSCVGPPTKPQSVLAQCKYENTAASTSGHEAAQLQAVTPEKRVPQTARTPDITHTSYKVEAPSSRPSNSCDLDSMDLDQLRREKIKMQIKVLRLQEEYYTQKLKGHRT